MHVASASPSGSNLGADRVRVDATLSDRKGIVASFSDTFDLPPDCP